MHSLDFPFQSHCNACSSSAFFCSYSSLSIFPKNLSNPYTQKVESSAVPIALSISLNDFGIFTSGTAPPAPLLWWLTNKNVCFYEISAWDINTRYMFVNWSSPCGAAGSKTKMMPEQSLIMGPQHFSYFMSPDTSQNSIPIVPKVPEFTGAFFSNSMILRKR